MKKLLFSSLFLFTLLSLGCADSTPIKKPDFQEQLFRKHHEQSRNKTLPFQHRKAAIDSLIFRAKKTQNDSLLISSISYKSYLFKTTKAYDSALHYAKIMYTKSTSVNDTNSTAKALFKIGLFNYRKGNWLKAFKHYDKSKNLYIALEDSVEVGKKLLTMAVIQKKLGDFNGSEFTATIALNFLNASNNQKYISGLYHHLTVTSKEQKNYKEALYWNQKALDFTTDSLLHLKYQNTKATILLKNNNPKLALNILKNIAIHPLLALKDNITIKSIILDNLAYAKSKLNYAEAKQELLSALQVRKDQNGLSGQFASHIHLATHYQDRDQKLLALPHAEQAYTIAKTIKSVTAQLEALSYLIDLKNNPKSEAITYRRLNDSLNAARNQAKNQFAKLKYDTDQNREENLALKAKSIQQDLDAANDKSQKLILALIILSILGLGIFFFKNQKQKGRIARIQERHKTENKLSKQLHDEIGNDFFHLTSQLQEQIFLDESSKNKILMGFGKLYQRIRVLSRDTKVETGSEYGEEIITLLNSYGDATTIITTNHLGSGFWDKITAYKKVELYWILKELLTNMKKHSRANYVSVVFSKEGKNIIVRYKDDGIGIPINHSISKNGLRNVENRIREIGGTITFDSKPTEGFKVTMVFTS